jgi:formylglycine-generating enzyme required for sulfatase activity
MSSVKSVLPPPFEWVDISAGRVMVETVSSSIDPDVPVRDQFRFDVPAFQIAKYPLTNAQYARFMETSGYRERKWWTAAGWQQREQDGWTEPRYWRYAKWNGAEKPVVGVSWYEAVAFCRWLSEVSGEPVMLPTEQRWQRAAQGDDGREYPWGNEWDGARCNNSVSPRRSRQTTPVTQYPNGASPFGAMDMSGNVWEWCLTVYESGSTSLDGTDVRVLRGGSWNYNDPDIFRASYRTCWDPSDWSADFGFRCVRSR